MRARSRGCGAPRLLSGSRRGSCRDCRTSGWGFSYCLRRLRLRRRVLPRPPARLLPCALQFADMHDWISSLVSFLDFNGYAGLKRPAAGYSAIAVPSGRCYGDQRLSIRSVVRSRQIRRTPATGFPDKLASVPTEEQAMNVHMVPLLAALAASLSLGWSIPSQANIDALSNKDAVSGLKAALEKGSGVAVDVLCK